MFARKMINDATASSSPPGREPIKVEFTQRAGDVRHCHRRDRRCFREDAQFSQLRTGQGVCWWAADLGHRGYLPTYSSCAQRDVQSEPPLLLPFLWSFARRRWGGGGRGAWFGLSWSPSIPVPLFLAGKGRWKYNFLRVRGNDFGLLLVHLPGADPPRISDTDIILVFLTHAIFAISTHAHALAEQHRLVRWNSSKEMAKAMGWAYTSEASI